MRHLPTYQRAATALLALLLAIGTFCAVAAPTHAADADAASNAKTLLRKLDSIEKILPSRNYSAANKAYTLFDDAWFDLEGPIKAASKEKYLAIEEQMRALDGALKAQDGPKAQIALDALQAELTLFADGKIVATASTATNSSVSTYLEEIAEARQAIARQDAEAARDYVKELSLTWVDVELVVKPVSAEAYNITERAQAEASTALAATPPDFATADAALTRIEAAIQPIATKVAAGGSIYGPFDAAVIILREGLEAMLVVFALVAFLNKSGNGNKRGWIWGGGAIAVVASIITAFALQAIFSGAASGTSRELVEGVIGLLAAGMLFYVSYWLHSKSSVAGWQTYIRKHSTAALASGSLFSLALLAFLAVYREGAETILFYVGMAPSISIADLLIGFAIGALGLLAVGVAITRFGLRIPLTKFFLISSLLIYYIGFKFVGSGIHGLQVAGVVPATSLPGLPDWGIFEFFGIYPTVETMVAQALLLVAGVTVWVISTRRQRLLTRRMQTEQAVTA